LYQDVFDLTPATKILLWLVLAIGIHQFDLYLLAVTTAPVVLKLFFARETGAWIMLRRSRWLLLSLLGVYAFATPGDPLFPAWGFLSPSLSGLESGLAQAWRLALLLSTLALLMRSCPRERLLSGIYQLLRPLRLLGVTPERIAVRLWLTLHYVQHQEAARGDNKSFYSWWHELRSATELTSDAPSMVSLELFPFTWRDATALLIAALLLGLLPW
jgi:energy-coupling factor transporter transmembrane protein EcfT